MTFIAEKLIKVFPGVRALDQATLRLEPGTVHALLGENGAGKSTLIKVVTGVYQPDGGRLLSTAGDGTLAEVSFSGPLDAQRAGIGVVHQERNLVPAFSVAENIALQAVPKRRGFVDHHAMRDLARRCLERLDVQLDVDRLVGELSVAQMQLVEIAKALAVDSTVLLLDEPTASLTADESDRLYDVVRSLRDQGQSVVLVSHKLEEVFAVADTVTVLRDGRSVAEAQPLANYSRDDVVTLMVGRAHADLHLETRKIDNQSQPALELDDVSTSLGHHGISLHVQPGEILGLYGLVGAGRSELARAILGLDAITGGALRIHGAPAHIGSVSQALQRYRLGYVTENRKEEGVFLDQTIARNVSVTVWRRLARAGLVRNKDERVLVDRYRDQLGMRISSPLQLAGQLSGGNQQKVSLAKWLAADCQILVIDEPTVGIDVRTKAAFHELIVGLADSGIAILLISSDLPEMITLADRIAVMSEYRIVGELDNDHRYEHTAHKVIRMIHAEVAS
ncbi:MAG: transporter related protein [Frankiales bacterium]|jgi:ribose transport system ATP-binding protein|nr:transporter related protein [Frankiales bacterium]MCW2709564.1 transporter related protein [Frankiales bacterium]